MKKINSATVGKLLLIKLLVVGVLFGCNNNSQQDVAKRSVQVELSQQDSNVIKTSWPSIGCWFWIQDEFEGEGYKQFIDLHEKYSSFTLLTTSLRYPGDLTDPALHDRIKAASLYARSKDMALVMDLDIRLARDSFRAKYPDELQQIVFIRDFTFDKNGTASIGVKGKEYADHYTYGRTPYSVVDVTLLRVYGYNKDGSLVKAGSVKDITDKASTKQVSVDSVYITLEKTASEGINNASAMVAVTVHTPDVFAPHLLSYQREILKQYADASLAGACKDEWGFPGRFTTATDELWYSPAMAKLYAEQRMGRDLLRDLLLMSKAETGDQAERVAAINHYMEMNTLRNGEIETDYYHAIKEILGQQAMSGTHPTWFPYPDNREIFKNGLSWWASKRDIAQTDEATPFSARTALSKKMFSPLWFNMYYDKEIAPYYKDIWSAALAGGRLNYHPLWPVPIEEMRPSLLKDSVMLVESRVSLLNYISESAPDCPVAVVFGHPAAMNWSNKSQFSNVGLQVANALWKKGYYADLIPSSEIINGSLKLNANGKIQYGLQQYEAVIYYQPQFDKPDVANFFKNAGEAAKTKVFVVGDWTIGFDGKALDGKVLMGTGVKKEDSLSVVSSVIALLQSKNISIQTEGNEHTVSGFPASVMPKPAGQLRLIDGTMIWIDGEQYKMGDPIKKSVDVQGKQVDVDAVGVVAVRFNSKGELEALAAGGLKSFKTGALSIELAMPVDIALIKEKGDWTGIIHSNEMHVPEALLAITKNWKRVKLPGIYTSSH